MGDGESLSKRTQLTVNLRRLKQNVAKFPWYVALYVVVAVTAAAMRFWDLGVRAFHHDESLHAFYSWNLYVGEGYIHNPMMHGPFQMEATAGLFFLFGDNDYTARLLYAIAGTALVLLPLLFRSRLGNWGALFTSMLLAFSPAMLYFSRFARNDILMAVWALGIVIAMWRYLDEGVGDAQGKCPSRVRRWGSIVVAAIRQSWTNSRVWRWTSAVAAAIRYSWSNSRLRRWASVMVAVIRYGLGKNGEESEDEEPAHEPDSGEPAEPPPKMGNPRYLYITAALLAFAFASKESAYLITATMGLYLVVVITSRNWNKVRSKVNVGVDSPPVAAVKIVGGWLTSLERGLEMRGISKEAGFLVLLITITLPLWGAFVSILQDTPFLEWSGLTLAGHVGGAGAIGAPLGRGCTGRRLPRYGVPDLSVVVLRPEVEHIGLVEGGGDLLRALPPHVHVVPHERFRSGFRRVAVSGLLGRAAGRGERQSTLVLLHRDCDAVRVPALAALHRRQRVLPPQTGQIRPVLGVLGMDYFPALHARQREDALAAGEHHPADDRPVRQVSQRHHRACRMEESLDSGRYSYARRGASVLGHPVEFWPSWASTAARRLPVSPLLLWAGHSVGSR